MRRLLIILLSTPLFSLGQTDLLPTVAWRTYVRNVEQLTDSTYKFDVMPLDWNEAGAAVLDYGNYFQDYAGNKYEVIDSSYLSVTVLDIFETGVSPQVDRVGVMYQSPDPESEYLAPINYQYLDETALDNARAVELAYLWRHANLYAQDSSYLVWWNDTIVYISTKYDIDTLHQKTIDSLLIHRTEIDELKNQSDSLSAIEPATTLEAQIGINNSDYITPLTLSEQIELNTVRYYGNREDVYLNGFKLIADSIIVQSVRSWMDSLLLVGNVHVTDTLSARKLRLTAGDYTEGYYLKVNSHGNIIAQAISGALIYQGTWNAHTNTPTLSDGTGTNGYYYRVVVGDTINLGSGDIIFNRGDDVMYNGSTWERIPGLVYVLEAATATVLGGVKKGDNVNIAADGTISITKQTLTAGSNAGQLSISEGNSVTINVNDADHSSTNELQNLTWDETTGNLGISLGTGDNLDGRYTLITDWQDSVIYFTNRLSEHSDSLIQLFAENDVQSDSIQLLSDSLFYYVLTATFEDSLLQLRGDMNSDFSTVSDSLSYYVLTTVFDDSLTIFRHDVSDLQDTVSVHLDTLQSHNLRILALSNNLNNLKLDILDSLNVHHARISVNEVDIAAIYDSLTNIYTEAQVNAIISEINNRLLEVEGLDTTGIYHANRTILDAIDETWNDFSEWNKDYFDLINRPNFQDSISTYQTDDQQLSIDSIGRRFTITLEDGGSISFIDTNTEYDLSPYATSVQLGDSVALLRSEIPTMLTQLSDAGFTITESQISDLKDYLLESDVSDLRDSVLVSFNVNKQQSDSISDHESRIVTLEAFEESDPVYAADSTLIGQSVRNWLNSIAYGITGTDTTYWNNKVDDVSDIETNIQTLIDSLNYYLLITDFNDSMIVLRSEIPSLLTELDSTGFRIKEAQISDLQPYLLESDLQPLKDTIKINSDSIDVLAGLINDIETIAELATILEAQSGVSDKLMTALRTAEQLTLNAIPYYNVKEDIYSNFDATFNSIFASNLYQETVSTSITGTGGVYDKEVSTNNIEVYLNGVLQRENVNYTQTETQITFIKAPLSNDYITIKYK